MLELDLAPAELLLEDFASLELDLTSLLEDLALLEDAATLELLGIDFHCADTDKSSDTVAGISVTMSLPHFQPAKE